MNNERPTSTPRLARNRQTAGSNAAGGANREATELNYFRLIWERRFLVLTCLLIFTILGIIQVKQTPAAYDSTAELKYEPAAAQIVDFGERSTLIYTRDEIRTAVQLIRSPAVARAVLDALGENTTVESQPDTSPTARIWGMLQSSLRGFRSMIVSYQPPRIDPQRLADQQRALGLLNRVYVAQRPDTKLIQVRAVADDPEKAARIANEFCTQFIRRVNEDKQEAYRSAQVFLRDTIEQTKLRLDQTEREMYAASGNTDLQVLDESRKISIDTLLKLTNEIEQQKNRLALLRATSQMSLAQAAHALTESENEVYRNLAARLSELLIQESSLSAENEPDYRPLVRVRREIESIRNQLTEAATLYVEAQKGQLDLETKKLEQLEQRLREHQTAFNALEDRMISFRVKQREVDSTRQVFNALLDQYKRLEVVDEATASNISIVRRGEVKQVPMAPNVTRILGTFMFIGLAVGVGLVLGLNWLDRSVKDPMVVERTIGLPSLGFVPYLQPSVTQQLRMDVGQRVARSMEQRLKRHLPHALASRMLAVVGRDPAGGSIVPVTLLEPESRKIESEAFRYLRTSLQYSSAEHAPQLLLVTSCFPQEGKSTVASNLGIIFAEQGRRTLIIDADLKRPNAHRAFGLARIPGLTDVLTGQKDVHEAIARTSVENLDILPAGLATPAPVTLLESQAMTDLLNTLRSTYSTIIVDSPPSEGMADALVLSTKVDGIVLVVKQGQTPAEVLARVADKFRSIGGALLGVVYNNSIPGGGGYYGYGYYGTGYGYRYQSPAGEESPEVVTTASSKERP